MDDAAALLLEISGGGLLVYLADALNQRGRPESVATTRLSDQAHVQVEELAVESGRIRIRMLTHRTGDPVCCPTEMREMSYALVGGELVP